MFTETRSVSFASLAILLLSAHAVAHPMGNFSISRYASIQIRQDHVELEYLVDMAEIPAFQEMQQAGITADPADPHVERYLRSKESELAQGLSLTVNGSAIVLRPLSHQVLFTQGAGNLPTMKMGLVYRATPPAACRSGACELEYRDSNFPGRAGWKEIVTSGGPGVRLNGRESQPRDRSAHLTNYPTDLLNSPPQDLEARFGFTLSRPQTTPAQRSAPPIAAPPLDAPVVAIPPLELKPNRQSPPRNAFTELISRKDISLGFAIIAALIAAGLGALHALEPGHGKTIVAAYLVGSKGTACHALLLGLIVTLSHTAGVYLLGGITLYAQKYIMPDRIYPFLSVISGVLIACMGLYIFLKRYMGDDFSLAHNHGPSGHSHIIPNLRQPMKRQLMILGITGGMVPCPAALVVLLSAVALHRVGFGLFLIVAFSVGLALVLIGMGLAAVYAGRLLARVPIEGNLVRLWMPAISAAMITILGIGITVQGLATAGIVHIRI